MAQAFRSRKSVRRNLNSNQLIVTGTYELDKVVVEWERNVAIDELVRLIQRLPVRGYKKSELRFYLSGYLRDSHHNLPDSKFRSYRISAKTLKRILEVLEANETIKKTADDGKTRFWIPIRPATA